MTPARHNSLLPPKQCDMCDGTGLQEELRMKDGSMIWMTTSAEANKWIYDAEKNRKTMTVDVVCRTCDGTGILPDYLQPGYYR